MSEYNTDPAHNLETIEIKSQRRDKGCNACKYRDKSVSLGGVSLCTKKLKPVKGVRYCYQWRVDDEN